MPFEFINTLSESKLIPTTHSIEKYKERDLPEFLLLNFCALRVLLSEKSSSTWAKDYVRKTRQWGNFNTWRNTGTDLYQLLHVLQGRMSKHDHTNFALRLDYTQVMTWLRDARIDDSRETLTRRLFLHLDRDLKVQNESLKAIRRLVMDWPTIDHHQRSLAVTRMLQLFRTRMPRSELLGPLNDLAKARSLELKDAENPETLDGIHEGVGAPPAASAVIQGISAWVNERYRSATLEFETVDSDEIRIEAFEERPSSVSIRSAIMTQLCALADEHQVRVSMNPTGDDVSFCRKFGFERRPIGSEMIRKPKVLSENASAGATSAASVASSVNANAKGAIGVGFDPTGDWGVYDSKKKKQKATPGVLRR